jgi:hypothetical protein
MRMETDAELLTRIANAYGMWGAFLGHAMECRGEALDECAKHVKLERRVMKDEDDGTSS